MKRRSPLPSPTLTALRRRRLAAGLKAQVRRYEQALKLLHRVDPEVFAAGRELFSEEAALAVWLSQPARALGGKIPLQVMRTGKGRHAVANLLRALAHGVYQ